MRPPPHLRPAGQDLSSLTNAAMQQLGAMVLQDPNFQRQVGSAAGAQAARDLRPWVIAGVGALAVLAIVQVAKAVR